MQDVRKRILLLLTIALVSLAVLGCTRQQTTNPPNPAEENLPPSASPSPLPEPGTAPVSPKPAPASPPQSGEATRPADIEEQSFKLTLAAVGDVLIHSSVYKDAKTADGYDFKPMFEPVKRYIEEADIALANQESMIGGEELGLSDYPRFNGPYEVGDALKDAGFDVVNLANNHTLDRGAQAVANTIGRYKELGLLYTGAYLSEEDQSQLRTLDKNGISCAFLSYTYGTNGIPVPQDKAYIVNLIDSANVGREVAQARKQADVVIVSFHFGQEYADLPNDEQKRLARDAAEAGATIIIGHHPHVLQPTEWIETTDGRKAFIVYSLGNFIAAQDGTRKRIGGILQLDIVKTVKGNDASIQVERPTFIPTWIHKVNWRQYKIETLRSVEDSQLPHADTVWKNVADHMKQWMPELHVVAN